MLRIRRGRHRGGRSRKRRAGNWSRRGNQKAEACGTRQRPKEVGPMVTCTPSHQGTNRPRKDPNGVSDQPTKRAPWPRHKGAARRSPPRACRGSETTNGSIGANRGEKGPGQHPAHS
ncbi:hypothetical protein V6N13_098930 [Hibiscus sabdariffa]